jgi:anti-sigma factor RsiW
MTTQLSPHEWEQLSAYMDGQLSINDTQAMGKRLDESKELRQALEQLRHTQSILKAVPMHRVRRNFTLTAEMVKTNKVLTLVPVFRFASALASLGLVVLFLLDFGLSFSKMSLGASAPMAPAMEVRSADQAAEEVAPQIIFWGSPTPEYALMGKGGGAPPGPMEGAPQASMPVEEPVADSVLMPSTTVQPAEEVPMEVQAEENTLLPTPTPVPESTVSAETYSSPSDSSSGPILGIPPSEEQGNLVAPMAEEALRVPQEPFDYKPLVYAGLVLIALGGMIASAIIRKKY